MFWDEFCSFYVYFKTFNVGIYKNVISLTTVLVWLENQKKENSLGPVFTTPEHSVFNFAFSYSHFLAELNFELSNLYFSNNLTLIEVSNVRFHGWPVFRSHVLKSFTVFDVIKTKEKKFLMLSNFKKKKGGNLSFLQVFPGKIKCTVRSSADCWCKIFQF